MVENLVLVEKNGLPMFGSGKDHLKKIDFLTIYKLIVILNTNRAMATSSIIVNIELKKPELHEMIKGKMYMIKKSISEKNDRQIIICLRINNSLIQECLDGVMNNPQVTHTSSEQVEVPKLVSNVIPPQNQFDHLVYIAPVDKSLIFSNPDMNINPNKVIRKDGKYQKTIQQIDPTNGTVVAEFNSTIAATRFITNNPKTRHSQIWEVLHGRQELAYGFKWRYKYELTRSIVPNITKFSLKKKN
jgi:hypothetical protein